MLIRENMQNTKKSPNFPLLYPITIRKSVILRTVLSVSQTPLSQELARKCLMAVKGCRFPLGEKFS